MKTIFIVFMFLGIIMVIHAYYEDKYKELRASLQKTKYAFLPRSEYDEALFGVQAYEKNRVIFGPNPLMGGRKDL